MSVYLLDHKIMDMPRIDSVRYLGSWIYLCYHYVMNRITETCFYKCQYWVIQCGVASDMTITVTSKWALRRLKSPAIWLSVQELVQADTNEHFRASYLWALHYYSDLMLSQAFQPLATQLSKKAALPLAKIISTASCRSSKTGPWSYVRKIPLKRPSNVENLSMQTVSCCRYRLVSCLTNTLASDNVWAQT